MTRDEELWAIALHLERKHGEQAPKFVAERVGALALAGDMAGIETWKRIAAKASRIWALHEATPDITLAELRAALADEGVAVAVSTLWRFFARHSHTRKKRPAMRKSRTVPTC